MKSWNIQVFLLDENGAEKPANCFTKVVYNLHPTFLNPVQSKSFSPPQLQTLLTSYSQLSPNHHSNARMKAGESST